MIPTRGFPTRHVGGVAQVFPAFLAVPHHGSTPQPVTSRSVPPLQVGHPHLLMPAQAMFPPWVVPPLQLTPARDGEMVMIPMSLAHVSWSRSPAPLKNSSVRRRSLRRFRSSCGRSPSLLPPSSTLNSLPLHKETMSSACLTSPTRGEKPHPHPCSHRGHGCPCSPL